MRVARSESRCRSTAYLFAQVWVAQVGRIPLLMDSDVEQNMS